MYKSVPGAGHKFQRIVQFRVLQSFDYPKAGSSGRISMLDSGMTPTLSPFLSHYTRKPAASFVRLREKNYVFPGSRARHEGGLEELRRTSFGSGRLLRLRH